MPRTMSFLLASSLLCAPWLTTPAAAQVETSVSGVFFTDFRAPTDGRAASFNVTRAFLTGRVQLDPVWSGTITYNTAPLMHVTGLADGEVLTRTEAQNALLQCAFMQAKNLVPGVTLQMGMLANPWFEFESGFWGYRMLGLEYYPVFNSGEIPSYDLGIQAAGSLGPLRIAAQVDNGAGSRATENTASKAYTGIVSVEPLSGLTLAAMGYHGDTPTWSQADRYAAFAGYRRPSFRMAAEVTRTRNQTPQGASTESQILSAFWVVGLPIPALPSPEVIARVDHVDRPSSTTLQGLLGFSVRPTKGVTLVLFAFEAFEHDTRA